MIYIVKTFAGLEDILVAELIELGATEVVKLKRGASFEGDLEMLYRANYFLSTGLRILSPIAEFESHNENQLYTSIKEIDWSPFLKVEQTFAIDAVVYSSFFKHSHYVGLKAKDAIVDQFREKMNRRPSVDVQSPHVQIHIHVAENKVSVSLDASGESLHKRGYRQSSTEAPLNEVLAAGIVRLSSWDKTKPLVDAMCGSGTILTEAGINLRKMPPQLRRKHFAFMNWQNFDAVLWEKVKSEDGKTSDNRRWAMDNGKAKDVNFPSPGVHRLSSDTPIIGFDWNEKAVRSSQSNIESIGLSNDIRIHKKNFFENEPSYPEGVLIMNPPYDERMKLGDDILFHKQIGDALKKNWKNWQVWIFTGNLEAAKFIGLRPSRKIHLFNGAIESRLLRFDVY